MRFCSLTKPRGRFRRRRVIRIPRPRSAGQGHEICWFSQHKARRLRGCLAGATPEELSCGLSLLWPRDRRHHLTMSITKLDILSIRQLDIVIWLDELRHIWRLCQYDPDMYCPCDPVLHEDQACRCLQQTARGLCRCLAGATPEELSYGLLLL